jgi:hypothetical protein
MWQKRKSRDDTATLRPLTSEQRIAIAELCEQLAADPRDEIVNPVILSSGDREVEVAGVWLRYRLRPLTKEIVFLSVQPL